MEIDIREKYKLLFLVSEDLERKKEMLSSINDIELQEIISNEMALLKDLIIKLKN